MCSNVSHGIKRRPFVFTLYVSLVRSINVVKLTWRSYTDISSGFFPAAKERFKEFSGIEFATLDITKDPVAQGFQADEYDLILAFNVQSSPEYAIFERG